MNKSLPGKLRLANMVNNFPVKDRTNQPLLFKRKLAPKPIYLTLLDLKKLTVKN